MSVWRGKSLGVIGGGNMAEALVRGALAAGLLPAGKIEVFDPLPERRRVFAELGCGAAETPGAARAADVVLLAVKPQQVDAALRDAAAELRPGALVVSIAAGVTLERIAALLPPGVGAVRVMPNTPLLVGRGASALAAGPGTGPEAVGLARELFACAGLAVEVEERHIDAVTALSGSGPAYLFRFAEALIAAGTDLGLPPDLAEELTVAMLRGSAEMLERSRDPAELRRRVTSPGGTTAAALRVFDDGGFAGLVRRALSAARDRSVELGGPPQ